MVIEQLGAGFDVPVILLCTRLVSLLAGTPSPQGSQRGSPVLFSKSSPAIYIYIEIIYTVYIYIHFYFNMIVYSHHISTPKENNKSTLHGFHVSTSWIHSMLKKIYGCRMLRHPESAPGRMALMLLLVLRWGRSLSDPIMVSFFVGVSW